LSAPGNQGHFSFQLHPALLAVLTADSAGGFDFHVSFCLL